MLLIFCGIHGARHGIYTVQFWIAFVFIYMLMLDRGCFFCRDFSFLSCHSMRIENYYFPQRVSIIKKWNRNGFCVFSCVNHYLEILKWENTKPPAVTKDRRHHKLASVSFTFFSFSQSQRYEFYVKKKQQENRSGHDDRLLRTFTIKTTRIFLLDDKRKKKSSKSNKNF